MATKNKASSSDILGEDLHQAPVVDVPSETSDGLDGIDKTQIDSILTSEHVRNGGKVRIERRGPTDQVFQYVCRIPIEDFDLERIKMTYGGGDYKCQTFRGNGQLYKPFTFSVDYRFKGSLDEQQIKMLSADDGKNNAASDRQSAMLQQLLMQRTGGQNDMMMQLFTMSSERSDRMFQMMMQQNAEAQKTTATIIAACMGSRGNGMDPLVAELLKAQLTAKPVVAATPSDPVAQLSTLRELLTIAKELGGGAPKETEKPSMVEQIIGAAAPLLERWAVSSRGDAPPRQRQPQAQAPVVQPSTPLPDPGHEFRIMINSYLTQIIKAAERNSDPQLYADIIVENLPADKLEDVIEILTAENWREILFNNDERVLQHIAWFDELRQLILSARSDSSGTGIAEPSSANPVIKQPDGPSSDLKVAGDIPRQVSG